MDELAKAKMSHLKVPKILVDLYQVDLEMESGEDTKKENDDIATVMDLLAIDQVVAGANSTKCACPLSDLGIFEELWHVDNAVQRGSNSMKPEFYDPIVELHMRQCKEQTRSEKRNYETGIFLVASLLGTDLEVDGMKDMTLTMSGVEPLFEVDQQIRASYLATERKYDMYLVKDLLSIDLTIASYGKLSRASRAAKNHASVSVLNENQKQKKPEIWRSIFSSGEKQAAEKQAAEKQAAEKQDADTNEREEVKIPSNQVKRRNIFTREEKEAAARVPVPARKSRSLMVGTTVVVKKGGGTSLHRTVSPSLHRTISPSLHRTISANRNQLVFPKFV